MFFTLGEMPWPFNNLRPSVHISCLWSPSYVAARIQMEEVQPFLTSHGLVSVEKVAVEIVAPDCDLSQPVHNLSQLLLCQLLL